MATRTKDSGALAWVGRIPDLVWGAGVASVLILIVGSIGLAFSQPWIFPSLGPTAYLQSETPHRKPARFYNTVAGHMVGLGSGFLALAIANASGTPIVLATHILTPRRVLASVLAIALTSSISSLIRASHPPAAATTLLVALGAFQTARDARTVVSGVLILAVIGELARQVRVRAIADSGGRA